MGPGYCWWWGGMWIFPIIMAIVMLVVVLAVLSMIFGRGGFRFPWCQDRNVEAEAPLEILKRRYAKGEITKEEFERMRKDLL